MKRDERETEQSNGVEWLWERGEADIESGTKTVCLA
jgi:hypothetical protein